MFGRNLLEIACFKSAPAYLNLVGLSNASTEWVWEYLGYRLKLIEPTLPIDNIQSQSPVYGSFLFKES